MHYEMVIVIYLVLDEQMGPKEHFICFNNQLELNNAQNTAFFC